jgi:antitoxin FitA
MAQLTVRNVSDEVAAALKARARRAGRSAEAEHRRILEEALRPAAGPDFFATARERRVRLPAGVPDAADLLREDRDRHGA